MNEGYIAFKDWDASIESFNISKSLVWSAIVFETKNVAFANLVVNNIRTIENAEFWVEIMPQLYRNGLNQDHRINEIMDYINYAVFTAKQNINFKTKKINKIIEDSNDWHYDGIVKERLINLPKSCIKNFSMDLDNERYIIKQLKTNHDLFHEGFELRHCVSSYTRNCLLNNSFIFSLRHLNKHKVENRLITIEVNENKIYQKYGKANRFSTPLEDKIIAVWAMGNNLV
jgi:hypothetical protein